MKMKMKKLISGVLVVLLSTSMLTGCANHQQKITKDDLREVIQEMDSQDKKELASILNQDTENNNVKENESNDNNVKENESITKNNQQEIKCAICGASKGAEYRSEFGRYMCESCYYRSVDAAMKTEDKYCAICGSTKNLSSYGTTGWICENCKIREEQKYDEAGDYCY